MKFPTFILALAAITHAAPQMVNFAAIDDQLPETTLVIPVTASPTILVYDPSSTLVSVEHATASAQASATPSAVSKRVRLEDRDNQPDDNSGCNACQTQKTTQNYLNANVGSDTAFLADDKIAAAASNAPTPSGYTKVFSNLKAASNGYVYMGYEMLDSPNVYNPSGCADKCNSIPGCLAFNIFVERDPTVDACSSTCQNPPAFANVKCSYWGGALTPGSAVNDGQWRNKFHVVIAGSNGYVSTSVPSITGYSPVTSLGNAGINAPNDCNGVDTYMGYKLFQGTPFDVRLCAAACESQNVYNLAHPPQTGKNRLCKFWNTYLLDKNGVSQGQYCSMYTEAWDRSFATNVGQYRGNDHYTISSSFSSYNTTSPGYPVCSSDIAYLQSEGGPFCTSYNNYVAPHTTTSVVGTISTATTLDGTVTVTTTPLTSTQTVTVTQTAINNNHKRDANATSVGAVETFMVIYPAKNSADTSATITVHVTDGQQQKRTAAPSVPTPASISGWEAASISEACSQVATGTITDTTTTSTSTVYAATITNNAYTEFLVAPTPVTTTTTTVTVPGVVLSSPTAIAGDVRNGAPADIDDNYYSITLPFSIGAFGSLTKVPYVSSNGVVSIGPSGTRGYAEYENAGGLPAVYLPDVAIAGFWDDLYIYRNTLQGIYYQVDGVAPHRTVTFEFYESAYSSPGSVRSNEYYHFAMIFYEDKPGYIRNEYYQIYRDGYSATVGGQKKSTNQVLVFSQNQPKIFANTYVILDTVAGTSSTGPL